MFLENAKFNFRDVGLILNLVECNGLPTTRINIWFYIQDSSVFGVFAKLKRLNFNLPGSWLRAGVSHFSIIQKHFPKKSYFFYKTPQSFAMRRHTSSFLSYRRRLIVAFLINRRLFVIFLGARVTFRSVVLHLNFHLQLGSFNYSKICTAPFMKWSAGITMGNVKEHSKSFQTYWPLDNDFSI